MLALHGISGRINLVAVGIRYLHHLLIRHHCDLGDRIDINADEVLGGNVAVRLDIDGDLPQKQLIHTIYQGQAQAGMPNQDFLSAGTGNDEGGIRRSFHIADQNQSNDQSDHYNYCNGNI